MSLSRRGFIGLLATGAVSACVAAKLPTAWLPNPVQRYAACEFLRKAWIAHAEAHKSAPTRMMAGQELFDRYESEIIANFRFTPRDGGEMHGRSLMFKGSRLSVRGRGWRVECEA